ncbi:hypothetical protein D3C75_1139490 [compost metagenome]
MVALKHHSELVPLVHINGNGNGQIVGLLQRIVDHLTQGNFAFIGLDAEHVEILVIR